MDSRRFATLGRISGLVLMACLASATSADESPSINGISFYGVVDLGVTYDLHGVPASGFSTGGDNHLIGNTSNKATWNLTQSDMGQSFLGLKGAEDLGNGWTALFKTETGINPSGGNVTDGLKAITLNNGKANNVRTAYNDSSQAGQAFNRMAFAGVSNDNFGTLTAGRQTSLLLDLVNAYDPAYSAYAFSLIGTTSAYAGGGSSEDTRWDSSLKYLYAYGPARLGLQYQFGGTITRNDTGFAADLGFDWRGLSVDGVYLHKKDEVSGSSLGTSGATSLAAAVAAGFDPTKTLTGTVFDSDTFSIAARYGWDKFKFYGAYEHIKNSDPSSPLFSGGLDIGGYRLFAPTNTAFLKDRLYDVLWGGVRYQVLPQLEVAGAYYYVHQNSYATGANEGCSDSRAANCAGETNVASLVANYFFSRKFQAYGGVMWSQVLDGVANGYFHTANLSPTVGLRYSF